MLIYVQRTDWVVCACSLLVGSLVTLSTCVSPPILLNRKHPSLLTSIFKDIIEPSGSDLAGRGGVPRRAKPTSSASSQVQGREMFVLCADIGVSDRQLCICAPCRVVAKIWLTPPVVLMAFICCLCLLELCSYYSFSAVMLFKNSQTAQAGLAEMSVLCFSSVNFAVMQSWSV